METLIGFAVGYLVGTQQGRDGLRNVRRSIEAISTSPEVRQLAAGGASVAGGTVRQLLSGGAGPMIVGAIEAITQKAEELFEDDRAA